MSKFQNQSKSTEKSAKSIDEAIEAALAELNAARDDVDIEVVFEGSKGFLGFGAKDAVVRVTMKPEPETAKPERKQRRKNRRKPSEQKPATPAEQKPATPAEQKPATPAEQKPAKPAEQKPAKPVEQKPATPAAAETFLTSLFAAMGLEVDIDVALDEDMMTVNLVGDNMGIVIGKRGDTLDSLQYLTSLVVNRRSEDYIKVTIDTENYREKRAETLIALSNRLAEKVARTGKKFTLEPMNPYERRIIHSNLQDVESVSTFSIGTEPYRKVVIAPKNSKRYDKRDKKRAPRREVPKAEKTGSAPVTYKADFKPTPHKAEYHSYEEYLAAQKGDTLSTIDD